MTSVARAPLRLLAVTNGRTIPNWLFQCLAGLERSGVAQLLLLSPANQEGAAGARTGMPELSQLVFRLYRSADRWLFRKAPDALAPVALGDAFPHRPLCHGADPVLRRARIDVVLDPFSLLPDRSLADRSRYGVWRVVFGQDGDPRTQGTPAFWEVVEGRPTTETRLCAHHSGGTTLSLYLSVAATDRRSPSRGQNYVYWRLSAALAGMLKGLWQDPDTVTGRLKEAQCVAVMPGPRRAPGNLETVRACAVLARRYLADKWAHARYREQWALAYQRCARDQFRVDQCRMLIPPKDHWWADPFPVRAGADTYVFHEEMPVATGKGRIVVTVVDGDGRATAPFVVLERDYHLSYPFVFQWDGEFFMIPETGSSRQVELYRCTAFPSRWRLERVLLSGVTAHDPTLASMFGRWWLFANIPADGAGPLEDLHLFHADTPLGPWVPHRANPIKGDVRSARPAGRIFQRQGQFYRPAQDGSPHYGRAVSINRVLRADPDAYQEREAERITPNGSPRVVGVHTVNRAGEMTVIDCLLRRRR